VSYTEQLIAQLREAGLVKTKHGPGGGYYLIRPADRITVADVFRVFDEPRTLDGRVFPPASLDAVGNCRGFGTDLLWKALSSYILLFLEGISLADIAPDTDRALPDHVGHEERGAGMSDTNLVTVH
jgi:Rrf2 family protein